MRSCPWQLFLVEKGGHKTTALYAQEGFSIKKIGELCQDLECADPGAGGVVNSPLFLVTLSFPKGGKNFFPNKSQNYGMV